MRAVQVSSCEVGFAFVGVPALLVRFFGVTNPYLYQIGFGFHYQAKQKIDLHSYANRRLKRHSRT